VFRLQIEKPVTRELRLVVRDRIDFALDLLAENDELSPETVHQLRKCGKRLKALFRLAITLNQAAGEQNITRYRDLGHKLADLLGYDHDLQNLSEILEILTVRPHSLDEDLQRLILQKECLQLGRYLYQKKTEPSSKTVLFHPVGIVNTPLFQSMTS
jgi:hypothetical protein